MKARYLEVTYRNGKPLAAYLYLPRRAGEKSARTEPRRPGLLVDFAADGKPIGIEITSPSKVTLDDINALLSELGLDTAAPEELAPFRAA